MHLISLFSALRWLDGISGLASHLVLLRCVARLLVPVWQQRLQGFKVPALLLLLRVWHQRRELLSGLIWLIAAQLHGCGCWDHLLTAKTILMNGCARP